MPSTATAIKPRILQILTDLHPEGTLFRNAYCQGTVCAPSRASFMRGRYYGKNEITWGEHFQKHGYSSTRVGKIFHMRVPGDIIAGTDGQDVPSCWSSKYNIPGKERRTRPGITPALISTSSPQNWKDANQRGCQTECL